MGSWELQCLPIGRNIGRYTRKQPVTSGVTIGGHSTGRRRLFLPEKGLGRPVDGRIGGLVHAVEAVLQMLNQVVPQSWVNLKYVVNGATTRL